MRIPSQRRRYACFLSAAQTFDRSRLIATLEQAGFSVANDFRAGSSVRYVDQVRNEISRVDLLLAVTTPAEQSPSVFFEIGYAVGISKPVIALIGPESPSWLFNAAGIITVRARSDNVEALSFTLENARVALLDRKRDVPQRASELAPKVLYELSEAPRRISQGGPLYNHATELVGQVDSLRDSPEAGRRLHNILRSVFELCSVSHIKGSPSAPEGPDFAVWHDGIENIVGNPLLIEVKRHVTDNFRFAAAVSQLATYLVKSNARSALLLYDRGDYGQSFRPPHIMACELRDFIRRLETRSFARVIRDLHRASRIYGT